MLGFHKLLKYTIQNHPIPRDLWIVVHRNGKNISKLSPHPIWQKILDNYRFCNYDIDVQRVYKEYKQGSRDWACKNIISTIRKQKNIDNNFTEKEILALYHEAQKDID